MKSGSPRVTANTIDVVEETISPRKSNRPYNKEKRSISNKMKDITYDNLLFDKVDHKIRSYLDKN